MSGSVVVGVDGTGNSLPAVRWGAAEAAARRLPLHLLHSWVSQPLSGTTGREVAAKKRYGAEALSAAVALTHELHPGSSVTTEQISDQAADALLECTRRATLLVLGSRGHGAIDGFLLGSVSLQVLGHAECPVVTVREDESAPYAQPEIVVGVQAAGTHGEAVLDFAFATADAHHARVRAVRAWGSRVPAGLDPTGLDPTDLETAGHETAGLDPAGLETAGVDPAARSPWPDADPAVSEEKMLAETLVPWRARYPGVEVVEQVEQGGIAPVLLSACSQASLLVVGRRIERTPMLLGPVVFAVLHHARCPVAVVPRV